MPEGLFFNPSGTFYIPVSFVAYESNELVGVAELKFRENKNYPEYEHWMGGVFVSPLHRNKGYGAALISTVINHASGLDIESLYLQCEIKHVPLYVGRGFVRVSDECDRAIMVLSIS